jgi:S-DNA-T family DNA segregation ATPase FtsK/SpoIIIE
MEKRYRILAKVKTKNLAGFNSRPLQQEPVMDDNGEPIPDKLPLLVIIIDELADVMMTDAKSDVETSIARIAQKGRASGIHIVIATQRPSVNIITGVIKANLPTRIAFKVGSIVDSRVILDQKGAEKLLGRGDMLFVPPGSANIERIQGAMVDDKDIEEVVKFVSGQAEQDFNNNVTSETAEAEVEKDFDESEPSIEDSAEISPLLLKYIQPDDDDLIKKSLEIILLEQKASTSYLQRRLKIGYNRAAEIMDKFEQRGLVSPPLPGGSKRDILVSVGIENG